MIFHWLPATKDRVAHTKEFELGTKVIGLKINNSRPNYVVITRAEIEHSLRFYSKETLALYLRDIRLSLSVADSNLKGIFIDSSIETIISESVR